MDFELMSGIRLSAESSGNVIELDDGQAKDLLNRISDAFVINKNNLWWWQSLRYISKKIDYGNDDGLEIINKITHGSDLVYLIITDDEFPPWPVFKGVIGNILDTISEQRYFEYFLVAEDESWCIFDNHHNSIILTGCII